MNHKFGTFIPSFEIIFILKPTTTKLFCSRASLVVEPGQLVPRYDQTLHPRFRDHHQVSHAPADVVSAHGQGQCCRSREMQETEDKEEVQEERVEVSVCWLTGDGFSPSKT